MDNFSRILIFVVTPLTLAYALTMSYLYQDNIAFTISLVGSFVILYSIGRLNG